MMEFLSSEEKYFACTVFALLCSFPFEFLYFYCPYFVFFPLCHRSRYEGDMSFLDAPDA